MKSKGIIINFNSTKGGYGEIKSENNLVVLFEKFECNYNYVRIGDEVIFDLEKSFDDIFDALNIEFARNSILTELAKIYHKQSEIVCKVLSKTPKGFYIDYKGCTLFLPASESQSKNIVESSLITVFIKYFSYGANIIASLMRNELINTVEKYKNYINKEDSFEFEVIEINNFGIVVCDKDEFGFIPNSHILSVKKEDLKIGDIVKACVISCSLTKGLVLSIRNHLLFNILIELNSAFKDQKTITGCIKDIYNKYIIVCYKDINLVLNKQFVRSREININELIDFKVINFSWSKIISISNIEIYENGIIYVLRNKNMFIGKVEEILDNGTLISLNEEYTGFMPFSDMSDIWKLDFSTLRKGSRIKTSITQFDFKGLYLSRLKYKRKLKKSRASSICNIGDSFQLKMKDKMALFGVLVCNESVNGLIPLGNILPPKVINELNKIEFVKYCKEIFKRRSQLKCVVSDINKEYNKVNFELDYSAEENLDRINNIINYFENHKVFKTLVQEFYIDKIENQNTAGNK